MNYIKAYTVLMQKARRRGWTRSTPVPLECHHIIPRSAEGEDDDGNLVYLTPREHFVAHKLLYKAVGDQKTAYSFVALARLSRDGRDRCSSRDFEKARGMANELSRQRMLEHNPGKGKHGKLNVKFKGVWHTPAGSFEDTYTAAAANGIGKSTLQRRCRNCDTPLTGNGRLGAEFAGKTWRDIGYWIEEVAIEQR